MTEAPDMGCSQVHHATEVEQDVQDPCGAALFCSHEPMPVMKDQMHDAWARSASQVAAEITAA